MNDGIGQERNHGIFPTGADPEGAHRTPTGPSPNTDPYADVGGPPAHWSTGSVS